jgi:hypothetical protein
MNFIKAVKHMREGKKLQRENNGFDHYYRLHDGYETEIASYFLDNKIQASEWVFSLEDFEANDWIILENKDS